MRNRYALLRKAPRTAIQFLDHENPFALAMSIDRREAKEAVQILVLLNGHAEESATFTLPAGKWSVLVDEQKAGVVPLRESGDPSIVLGPSSGMVLVR